MEFCDDSPVKKKRRRKNVKRPKICIIHVDETADDSTLSGFTEQSWKVIFNFFMFLKRPGELRCNKSHPCKLLGFIDFVSPYSIFISRQLLMHQISEVITS